MKRFRSQRWPASVVWRRVAAGVRPCDRWGLDHGGSRLGGPRSSSSSSVEDRLGSTRARVLEGELAAVGLVVVDARLLHDLERQAAGYRCLADLVERHSS